MQQAGEPQALVFSQVDDRATFVRYVRWMLWNYDERRGLRAVAVAGAVVLALFATWLLAQNGASGAQLLQPAALCLVVLSFAFWTWFVRVPDIMWKRYYVNAGQEFRFSERGVQISSANERSALDWSAFAGYSETPELYVIVRVAGKNVVVNKRGPRPESIAALGALLARKLPRKETLH